MNDDQPHIPRLTLGFPAWMTHAECAKPGIDPDMFYPRKGDNAAAARAKAICADCPVTRQCLNWALAHETGTGTAYRSGVYGGTSAYERRYGLNLDRSETA